MTIFPKNHIDLSEQIQVSSEFTSTLEGRGTLYMDKTYKLEYQPMNSIKRGLQKCSGVTLVIRKNSTLGVYEKPVKIPFKSGTIFNRGTFKSRLETAINEQIQKIKTIEKNIIDENKNKEQKIKQARFWELNDTEARKQAIDEYIKKNKSCRAKIDNTMKSLVKEAEPATEKYFKNKNSNEV